MAELMRTQVLPPGRSFVRRYMSAAQVASGAVIAIGGLVLLGWALGIGALKTITPGLAPMQANTALAMMMAGWAVRLLNTASPGSARHRQADALALSVGAIALLTVSETIFGWDPGIDQLLFRDDAATAGDIPGRMSLLTAVALALIGLALLLSNRSRAWVPQLLALVVFILGWTVVVGHIYGANQLYNLAPHGVVALHTAICLCLLGAGIMFGHIHAGPMTLVASDTAGGALTRRLIPVTFACLLIIGWLRLHGQRWGWYDTEFGLALMIVASTIVLSISIWGSARALYLADCSSKSAEDDLRASEARYRATFEQAAVGMARVSLAGQWLDVNEKLCEIVGYTRAELLELRFQQITAPEYLDADLAQVQQMLAGALQTYSMEKRYIRKDQSLVPVNLTVSLVRDTAGAPAYFISVIEDLTERKQLQTQLLQAQKMESIGRLAGGIAHDFNNLLTVIGGYAELAYDALPDSGARADLQEIRKAADSAAALTRQLLAFARKQVIAPLVINLNDLIRQLEGMITRLIGEDIHLAIKLAPELGPIRADPGHVEQVIMNLVVNARDAMPDGGSLFIETSNVTLDEDYRERHLRILAGDYVLLAITDTGVGIAKDAREHLFEPFFTTKGQHKGTGLGLSTVYGIVKQHGGYIWPYSEPGSGATFKIYLPQVRADAQALPSRAGGAAAPGGSETILLAEDEEPVRVLAARVLRERGYTVLAAAHGAEALRIAAAHAGPIDMLITDVVMPELGGRALADQLAQARPIGKVLFISGYTEHAIDHSGWLDAGTRLLQKPFTPLALAAKVREVLDSKT